jgi:hypothetical protein
MKDIEMEMEVTFKDANLDQTLAQIHAAKSFFGRGNSATSQNVSSDGMTLASLSRRKLELRLSLAHSNPLLQTSNTSQENGKGIVMRKDYLEFLLLE